MLHSFTSYHVLVSRSQTQFFLFISDGRKKGYGYRDIELGIGSESGVADPLSYFLPQSIAQPVACAAAQKHAGRIQSLHLKGHLTLPHLELLHSIRSRCLIIIGDDIQLDSAIVWRTLHVV